MEALWSDESFWHSQDALMIVEETMFQHKHEYTLGKPINKRIVLSQDEGIYQQDNSMCNVARSEHAQFEEHQDPFRALPWQEKLPGHKSSRESVAPPRSGVRDIDPQICNLGQFYTALESAWIKISGITFNNFTEYLLHILQLIAVENVVIPSFDRWSH